MIRQQQRWWLWMVVALSVVGCSQRRRRVSVETAQAADPLPMGQLPPAYPIQPPQGLANNAVPAGAPDVIATWSTSATTHRASVGRTLRVLCPPGGTASSVWGTDVYTDDSSICSAAVHTGHITLASGGLVVIRVEPGQSTYAASTRRGITSSSWNSYPGSFRVLHATPGAVTSASTAPAAPPGTVLTPWTDNAMSMRGRIGATRVIYCPAGGPYGSVWGIGPYTDDSSMCTAAVHAGRISSAGGVAVVEILPGQASYGAGVAYGVSTNAYGTWPGSFRIR